ncbi:uncharacterized protein LOC113294914 [Papaver somniferum]|uniref:uncharacterized protein LOC113294914 n=1 Tax=Papaver somniferum TaxID=3469 RepID=UPI000E6FFFCE|nr:uncharacterized protein LOC113294914 [Papaver somniferum]
MVHKHQTEVSVTNSGTSVTKWIPPSSPYYSICCDASFKSVNNAEHFGWGMIGRDFAGQFIRDECTYANGIVNAEEAEYKGLIQAMQVAENLELQMVCFELDAKLVIKAVNGDIQAVAWQNQFLILEIRSFLRKHPLWVCKFLTRKFNKPADRLARHARNLRVSNTWHAYPPNFIASVILEEAANYVHNYS